MGRLQIKQPMRVKVGIPPALMVGTSAPTSPAFAAAQDAAQPHSDPAIQRRERPAIAVLEVFKPAPQGPVHSLDDSREALAVVAPGGSTYRLFQFPKALLARPSVTPFKVKPQKVKSAFLGGIDDLCLPRMQQQSVGLCPPRDFAQRFFRFPLSSTQNDKVIRAWPADGRAG
jgi:hypothetical protein